MKPRPGPKPTPALNAAAARIAAQFKEAFAHHQQGRIQEATAGYERVLKLWPRHSVALHLLAVIALDAGSLAKALELVDASLALASQDATSWNTRAVVLQRLGRFADALEASDRSIGLRADGVEAHLNRGNALMALKQLDAAVDSFDRAIELRPDYGKAHANRGLAKAELMDFPQALASLDRAVGLGADVELVLGPRLHARMRLCDWRGIDTEFSRYLQTVLDGSSRGGLLLALSLTDSLALQRAAAHNHVAHKQLATRPAPGARTTPPARRLRLGYFSMDFREHAVAYLTAELFELHDRDRFEVYAFSFGPQTGDPTQLRLQRAFDRFIDVRDRTDDEVADLARSLDIDIAIDLAGLTGNARPGIFALRAAPVQVNYLGYPGTMGAPFIDYIVADTNLVPPRLADSYAEKVAWLRCFQANDRKREISQRDFSRQELGLPPAGFVFCCFNRSYKITPQVFDSWCRILSRVPGGTLLLHVALPQVMDSLRREAQARGIDGARLVFAPSLPQADYLARYRAAGLFLDTFPFNGGTTTSDALWAGLPVLTRCGEAYASRMGASLLAAARLAELVTDSPQRYEDLAVELATDPARLQALRERLQRERLEVPLFDSAAFTRDLEAAFLRMHDVAAAGVPPEHIRPA